MSRWNWEALAAASGLVFVVLRVIAFVVPDEPPGLDERRERFAAYFLDQAREVKVSTILHGLALMAFVWFLGSLAARLRRGGEERLGAVALGGGVVTAALLAVSTLVLAALAFQAAAEAPQQAKSFYDVAIVASTVAAFPFAVVTGAAAIAGWRARLFPRWYSALSGLLTVGFVFGGGALASEGFYAPDGEYSTVLVLIAFLVWIALTSGFLFRDAAEATATPSP